MYIIKCTITEHKDWEESTYFSTIHIVESNTGELAIAKLHLYYTSKDVYLSVKHTVQIEYCNELIR